MRLKFEFSINLYAPCEFSVSFSLFRNEYGCIRIMNPYTTILMSTVLDS
jgi:hypothetical protein